MKISDHTLEDAIFQEIDRICGTDDTNYTILAKIARYNQALDRFVSIALTCDYTWTFDDLNKGDLPIGTANLVSGQQDYEFADEILVVNKVLVKNASAGDWVELKPVNMADKDSEYIWTKPSTDIGIPIYYQKFAHSLLLRPIPNYASTGGLKVVFKRNAVKIVETDLDSSDDLSTECGVPSIFHPSICRMASLPYLIEKSLPQKNDIATLIQRDEQLIKEYFSTRSGDTRNVIKSHIKSFR